MHRFFVGLLCALGLMACRPDLASDQQRHLAIKDSVRRADSLQAHYLYDSLAGRLTKPKPDSLAPDTTPVERSSPAVPERALPAPRTVDPGPATIDSLSTVPAQESAPASPDTVSRATVSPDTAQPSSTVSPSPRSRALPPPSDSAAVPAATSLPDSSNRPATDSTKQEN